MDSGKKFVRCETTDGVAVVKIDRPPVNALSLEVLDELRQVFSDLAARPQVLVVIITGSGDRAFVAGADIGGLKELTPGTGKEVNRMYQTTFNQIADFRRPVICALNGPALGGGSELALACDIRFAVDTAGFGWPEVNLGLIPAGGGTQRLPRQVPPAKAKELIFTGRLLTAVEAERIGLVNQVVPDALAAAKEMARTIASKGPVAVAQAKQAMNQGLGLPLPEAFALELRLSAACFGTEDAKEGISAFFEKRTPEFKGK